METAVERHDRMVREERDQAERLRTDQADADIWKPNAGRFRPADATVDPAVDVLAAFAGADGRAVDVGAGGGRIALPLASRVQEVVAVEPSPAMRSVLEAEIQRRGIDNVSVVPARWEDADIAPASLVFAAHVTYGVQDIEPFVRKIDRVATDIAALVAFDHPPQFAMAPFWRAVYGEERLRLPCREELQAVLLELGAEPQEAVLPPQVPQALGTPDDAFAMLRRRMYIGAGNLHERKLESAIDRLTRMRDGELWPVDSHPNPVSIIFWRPGAMA